MKIKSTIRIMVCLLILLSIAFPALAQMDNTIYNLDLKGREYVESEAFIMSKNITKEKLELLKRACEEAEKKDSLSEYSMYNNEEAKFYENSINNLIRETDKVVGTGLYFKNASFSDSYIYNNSGYSRFSSNNTNSARRGAFEADWTTRNNNKSVTVHSYNQWYEEKISIEF